MTSSGGKELNSNGPNMTELDDLPCGVGETIGFNMPAFVWFALIDSTLPYLECMLAVAHCTAESQGRK